MQKIILFTFFIINSFTCFTQTVDDFKDIVKFNNANVLEKLKHENNIKIEIRNNRIKQFLLLNPSYSRLKKLPNGSLCEIYDIVNGKPIYRQQYNANAALSTRVNFLYSGGGLGLNVEGQGMIAYVWDGSRALQSHVEFNTSGTSKVSFGDSSNTGLDGNHSTHVSGTICASGVDPLAKGMAPQASLVSYDWYNDVNEAINEANNGMLLSNHSYGDVESSIPDWMFGAYNSYSKSWDDLMYAAPYYLMVSAAGNAGNDGGSNASPLDNNSLYDKLSSAQTSKNSIVVANADDLDVDSNGEIVTPGIINSSSSQGPTDDYRIKPDITGNGTNLYSSVSTSNNAYDVSTGTSMASPNVMGSLLLLQQLYFQEHGVFMKAATLKGLALHTADDIGDPGPDAITGWGYMNTKKAAETILDNNAIIKEMTLNQGESLTFNITPAPNKPLKVSISWTDPGSDNVNVGIVNDTTPVLVNDLDVIVTKSVFTYEPWKLNGVDSNTTGDNTVDPYEQVYKFHPSPGVYTVTISHKGNLVSGSQDFSIIVTDITSNSLNTNDVTNLDHIQLYPNPIKNILHLTSDNEISRIFIYDLQGRIINQYYPNNIDYTINFEKFEGGFYYLNVLTIDNVEQTFKVFKD